jgi:uncharacterized protein YukE
MFEEDTMRPGDEVGAVGEAGSAPVGELAPGHEAAMDLLLGLDVEDEPTGGRRVGRESGTTPETPQPRTEPPPVAAGGEDGQDIENGIAGYLDYLSQLCRHLGVPDPVEEYFSPVIGRWSAMHEEAERWRKAARDADEMSQAVTGPLGGLDAAWKGADADSFLDYMRRVGLAGNDMSDAMNSMAEVLDKTADGIREIVRQLADVLVDTAESTSLAMTMPMLGEQRARQHLAEIRQPAGEFFESVRDVVEAFVQLCDGAEGPTAFDKISMAHTFPEEKWSMRVDLPATPDLGLPQGPAPTDVSSASAPPAGAAAAAGGAGSAGGGVGGVGGVGASKQPASPGGYTMATEQPATPPPPPAAAANAQGGGGQRAGGFGGAPMMPMGMMGMGGAGGGDQVRGNPSRVLGRPEDIFGAPPKTSPEVIGEDEEDATEK